MDNISSTIGLNFDSLKYHFDAVGSQPVEDIKGDYNISGVGSLNLTFFDTKFFRVGLEYFRPLIRGFIILMLLLYNYKQIMTLLGQDPVILKEAVSTDTKRGDAK